MGYAKPGQTANGIHMRQFSRAFVFADKAGEKRFVFVNADSCMVSQGVKLEVRYAESILKCPHFIVLVLFPA